MPKIAMTAGFYQVLANREPPVVRERYVQFYRDLYRLYDKQLSAGSFNEGPGYSYTELGTYLLDNCAKKGGLNNLDLMVVVYWAHEFDPDHSSCGPFFAETYGIKGPILDVCDQGSAAFFTGLNIIQQYMRHGKTKKAMLLALEQTSIPRDKADHPVLPVTNAAAAIVIQKDWPNDKPPSYRLLESQIILESQICTSLFDAVQFLKIKCHALELSPGEVMIVLKKSSYFFKNYQYNAVKEPEFCAVLQMIALEAIPGFMPIMQYLSQILNSNQVVEKSYILLIDEDAESLNTGYLLLQVKK